MCVFLAASLWLLLVGRACASSSPRLGPLLLAGVLMRCLGWGEGLRPDSLLAASPGCTPARLHACTPARLHACGWTSQDTQNTLAFVFIPAPHNSLPPPPYRQALAEASPGLQGLQLRLSWTGLCALPLLLGWGLLRGGGAGGTSGWGRTREALCGLVTLQATAIACYWTNTG